MRQKRGKLGVEATPSAPETVDRLLALDSARWRTSVQEAKIIADRLGASRAAPTEALRAPRNPTAACHAAGSAVPRACP